MNLLKSYVINNSNLLFKHIATDRKIALFDNRGFFLTESAQTSYDGVKHQPHLYVAWTERKEGYYYIGKSFQQGGRWKRQHAYHLGTLAHHLLGTTRYDDQNHQHWIDNWMIANTINNNGLNECTIKLRQEVKIVFIPFTQYSVVEYKLLAKQKVREINTINERALIDAYRIDNKILLNVQHNSKTNP